MEKTQEGDVSHKLDKEFRSGNKQNKTSYMLNPDQIQLVKHCGFEIKRKRLVLQQKKVNWMFVPSVLLMLVNFQKWILGSEIEQGIPECFYPLISILTLEGEVELPFIVDDLLSILCPQSMYFDSVGSNEFLDENKLCKNKTRIRKGIVEAIEKTCHLVNYGVDAQNPNLVVNGNKEEKRSVPCLRWEISNIDALFPNESNIKAMIRERRMFRETSKRKLSEFVLTLSLDQYDGIFDAKHRKNTISPTFLSLENDRNNSQDQETEIVSSSTRETPKNTNKLLSFFSVLPKTQCQEKTVLENDFSKYFKPFCIRDNVFINIFSSKRMTRPRSRIESVEAIIQRNRTSQSMHSWAKIYVRFHDLKERHKASVEHIRNQQRVVIDFSEKDLEKKGQDVDTCISYPLVTYKLIQFHDNRRPAYFGTFNRFSKVIKARNPFAKDLSQLDYDIDSDEEWEEDDPEEEVEEICSDEEEENDEYYSDEEDNDWIVPDHPENGSDSEDIQLHYRKPSQQKRIFKKPVPKVFGPVFVNEDGTKSVDSDVLEGIPFFYQLHFSIALIHIQATMQVMKIIPH